jgi:hypothetical protein
MYAKFCSENLKGRDHSEDLYNIKLNFRKKKTEWKGTDLINLPQDRDHWQAVVNTVMNLRFP